MNPCVFWGCETFLTVKTQAIKKKYWKFKLHQDLGNGSTGTLHLCIKLKTSLQLVLETKGYHFYYKERIWGLHRWYSSCHHMCFCKGLSLVPGVHTEQPTASSNAISRGSDASGFYGHLPSYAYTLTHTHIIKSNASKYFSKDNLKIKEKGKKREERNAHV